MTFSGQPAWLPWPHFGHTRLLNAAAYCTSVSIVLAGQHWNEQVAGACDTVYGSDASQSVPSGTAEPRTLSNGKSHRNIGPYEPYRSELSPDVEGIGQMKVRVVPASTLDV